ncbi:hypothetical protein [Microbacterium testaceum]|uniref:hypothetical protein n=1 Tax=Microbacterium testaceum TaxID=2033 RepID=UPI001D171700|nr:hypothetical protein [Microbacterium testaceum]MCC4247995.1 hypothetical protein [Microbacterium testaceum]
MRSILFGTDAAPRNGGPTVPAIGDGHRSRSGRPVPPPTGGPRVGATIRPEY